VLYLLAAGTLALAVGAVTQAQYGWAVFSATLLAKLAYHDRHLEKFAGWLSAPSPGAVPEGKGYWDDLFAQLYRHERGRDWQLRERDRALERFRLAGQALTDGVVILDTRNRIQWCNETAERQLGLKFPGDVGQPINHLLREPALQSYLETADFSQPLALRSDRGEELALQVQIIPYGRNERLMHIKDVTQAERLDRMRRDFVANVSHELRTPLTVLSGFLETVRELKLDPARRTEYFALMSDQSRRMQRIVEDLLTLSTLETAPRPSDEQVRMRPLLAKLKADTEALSGGRHRITLAAQGERDLLGVESELASAFGNLASNAIRYTPEGGEVRLIWAADADGAEFAVEDTGIGIEKEHIPRLTERFYRVDRGRSRETGGTGLGLAIAKHALARHDAALEIESEPGKGSRFSARFPARRVAPAERTAETA
jgi:two-component system phosphate regulon sensor histidine kinase PhoR